MAIAVYIGRILMEFLFHLLRIVQKIRESPLLDHIDRLAARLDRSLFSENIQCLLQIARVNVRSALHNTVASVFKFNQRNAHIFGFDIVMVQPVRHADHLFDLAAHHPTEQINIVNTLIHQRTAVLLPCAAPGRPVVVFVVSAPSDMSRPIKQSPEPIHINGFPYDLHRFIKSVLVTGADLHMMLDGCRYDGVCVCNGKRNGFFYNTVTAMLDAKQRNLRMLPALRTDGHKLRLLLFYHFLIIRIPLHALIQLKFAYFIFHTCGISIADRHKLQFIVLCRRYMIW